MGLTDKWDVPWTNWRVAGSVLLTRHASRSRDAAYLLRTMGGVDVDLTTSFCGNKTFELVNSGEYFRVEGGKFREASASIRKSGEIEALTALNNAMLKWPHATATTDIDYTRFWG